MTRNQILRRPAVLLGVLALCALAYVWFAQRTYDYSSGDEAVYIGGAHSLAAGDGYRFNGNSDAPYPPGMSALLAPVAAISGDSYVALSRFNAVFGALGIAVVALYGIVRRQRYWPVIVALLVASAGYFRISTSGVEADVPFLVFSMGFLVWVEWITRRTNRVRAWLGAPVAAVLLVAIVATRSIGIAMLAGLFATGVARLIQSRLSPQPSGIRTGDLRALALGLGVGTAWWVAWGRWSAAHRAEVSSSEIFGTYSDQLRLLNPHQPDMGLASPLEMILRIPRGLVTHASRVAELLTNFGGLTPSWFSLPILLCATLLLIGIWCELRRPNPLAGWYLLAYIGVLTLWPFDEGIRYVLPIFPLLLMSVASAVEWLSVPTADHRLNIRRLVIALSVLGTAGAAATGITARHLSLQELVSLAVWVAVLTVGVSGIDRRWPMAPLSPRWRDGALLAFVALFAAVGIPALLQTAAGRLDPARPIRREGLRRGAEWIRRNTAAGSVVMSTGPRALHYTTGRHTVVLPITARPEALTAAMARWRPDYLILEDPLPFEYLRPSPSEQLAILERAAPQSLQLVARLDGARIFRVLLDSIGPPTPGRVAYRTP